MNPTLTTPSPAVDRRNAFLLYGLLLFLLLFVLSLYTLLHEGGHALMGLLFGGKITSFSANFFNLSAHVGIEGEFSLLQNALISVAGVSFPLLLCMAYLLLAPKSNQPLVGYFRLILFIGTVNTLLAWIAIPVLVLFGQTASDDSFNFLNYTGLHPLIVTGAALLVYLLCWVLFLRKMGGFQQLRHSVRFTQLDIRQPETQKNLGILGISGVVIMAATYALTVAMPDPGFKAPEGYETVAEFELSQGPMLDAVAVQFSVVEPSSVNLFIALNNVKGGPAKIHLVGPNGYDEVFFNDTNENLDIGKASVHPRELPLEPGDYELRVSFPRSKGRISVSIKKN